MPCSIGIYWTAMATRTRGAHIGRAGHLRSGKGKGRSGEVANDAAAPSSDAGSGTTCFGMGNKRLNVVKDTGRQ